MKPRPHTTDLITLQYLSGLPDISMKELLNVYVDRQYRRIVFLGSHTCSVNFEDVRTICWKDHKCSQPGCPCIGTTKIPTLQISYTVNGQDFDIVLKKKAGMEPLVTSLSIAVAKEPPADFDPANRPKPSLPKLELGKTILFWLVLIALGAYLIHFLKSCG